MTDEASPLAQYKLSVHLTEMLVVAVQSVSERIPIFTRLLDMEYGPWQRRGVRRKETLKAAAFRMITEAVHQAVDAGVSSSCFDVDLLTRMLLREFFLKWPEGRESVRDWLIRHAARIIRVRSYDAGGIWLTRIELDKRRVARVVPARRSASSPRAIATGGPSGRRPRRREARRAAREPKYGRRR